VKTGGAYVDKNASAPASPVCTLVPRCPLPSWEKALNWGIICDYYNIINISNGLALTSICPG
jgi:hypothetical protein